MGAVVIRRVVLDVAHHLRFRLSEWAFASILGVFSYRLLAPGNTFASSPSYAYMASWASEETWGYIIGLIAIVRLGALTINGTFEWFRPYSPVVRSMTAWLSGGVWFCLFSGFYVANPLATGWGTYLVLLVADGALAIWNAHEAGPAWRMRHHARRGR